MMFISTEPGGYLPLYAKPHATTLTFGDAIAYETDNGFQTEQTGIVHEITEQIREMAGMEQE